MSAVVDPVYDVARYERIRQAGEAILLLDSIAQSLGFTIRLQVGHAGIDMICTDPGQTVKTSRKQAREEFDATTKYLHAQLVGVKLRDCVKELRESINKKTQPT